MMSGGLVLSLAPGERVLINGVMLENGDRPSSLRISDANVRVLRCRDALKPSEVTTPVRRVYFAIQLFISGDLDPDCAMDALINECNALGDIFEPVNPDWIGDLMSMLERRNYYSALCHLKPILKFEDGLLQRANAAARARASEAA